MDFITNTLPTLKSLRKPHESFPSFPALTAFHLAAQPFSSLNLLLQAEEEDSRRVRPSKLGWWVDVRRLRGSVRARSVVQ